VIILTRKIFDARAMTIAGLAIVAIGAFFNLPITSEWQVGELYVGQLIQGIGLPMIALPLVDMFVGDLHPPAESIPAASVLNLSRVLSGTVAAAWASTSLLKRRRAKKWRYTILECFRWCSGSPPFWRKMAEPQF